MKLLLVFDCLCINLSLNILLVLVGFGVVIKSKAFGYMSTGSRFCVACIYEAQIRFCVIKGTSRYWANLGLLCVVLVIVLVSSQSKPQSGHFMVPYRWNNIQDEIWSACFPQEENPATFTSISAEHWIAW